MLVRLTALLYGFIFFAFLALPGCAPSTAGKPQAPSSPSPAGSAGRERSPTASIGESKTPSTSLEALRRGESSATSASSPLKDIYFDYDRYDLRPDARAALKANADWLKANPAPRLEIEGHCDERGTTEYNLALGAKRAQAVKDYLATLGIAAGRLSTISYGKEVPVCREQNEGCWQENRRGRFVVKSERPAT